MTRVEQAGRAPDAVTVDRVAVELAALGRRADVTVRAWYGRATGHWWALIRGAADRLCEAADPAALRAMVVAELPAARPSARPPAPPRAGRYRRSPVPAAPRRSRGMRWTADAAYLIPRALGWTGGTA